MGGNTAFYGNEARIVGVARERRYGIAAKLKGETRMGIADDTATDEIVSFSRLQPLRQRQRV